MFRLPKSKHLTPFEIPEVTCLVSIYCSRRSQLFSGQSSMLGNSPLQYCSYPMTCHTGSVFRVLNPTVCACFLNPRSAHTGSVSPWKTRKCEYWKSWHFSFFFSKTKQQQQKSSTGFSLRWLLIRTSQLFLKIVYSTITLCITWTT